MVKHYWYKKNKLQQLKGFIAVVEEGGISKAARKLNLPPSNVSVQISSLEEQLGVKFFKKNDKGYGDGRKIVVTADGQRAYDYIKHYIKGIDYFYQQMVPDMKRRNNRKISISCHPTVFCLLIPHVIREMQDEYDNKIDFRVSETKFEEAIEMMYDDKLDIAIFPKARDDIVKFEDDFECIPIWKYLMTAFAYKDHPITKIKDCNIIPEDCSRFISIGVAKISEKYKTVAKTMTIAKLQSLFMAAETISTTKGMAVLDRRNKNFIKHDDVVTKDLSHLESDAFFWIFVKKAQMTRSHMHDSTIQSIVECGKFYYNY